jgi:hypothetical protein
MDFRKRGWREGGLDGCGLMSCVSDDGQALFAGRVSGQMGANGMGTGWVGSILDFPSRILGKLRVLLGKR